MGSRTWMYGAYEIYADKNSEEYMIREPDDTRTGPYETLRGAKQDLLTVIKDEITALRVIEQRLLKELK